MSASATDKPGDLQAPHPELSKQKPLIFVVQEGEILYRHHQKSLEPVYYGKKGDYRFDDPECPAPGSFGVLYAGEDPECCLMESLPPHQGVPAVTGSYLDARAIAQMELLEPLRFVDLVSPGGLASIGADTQDAAHRNPKEMTRSVTLHPNRAESTGPKLTPSPIPAAIAPNILPIGRP